MNNRVHLCACFMTMGPDDRKVFLLHQLHSTCVQCLCARVFSVCVQVCSVFVCRCVMCLCARVFSVCVQVCDVFVCTCVQCLCAGV